MTRSSEAAAAAKMELRSALAAMASIAAGDRPAGDLERAILRLKFINQARALKVSWQAIADTLGYQSGRQLKRDTHRLAEHVTRQLRLAQNRNG